MLFFLDPDPHTPFPDPELAETEPNGLLAVGGDLSVPRLINAYREGLFPWFSGTQPILWWHPDPRTVLFPERIKVSRSLRRTLKRQPWSLRIDHHFAAVIQACAAPRREQPGTWLGPRMIRAYLELHRLGLAHSVEVWDGEQLVGGLYGLAMGRVFFGESMFSRASDASKVALVHLCRLLQEWGYALIDCQVPSDHLFSLGAETVDRRRFRGWLAQWIDQDPLPGAWNTDQVGFIATQP